MTATIQFIPGITIDDLRAVFRYDAETGVLTWLQRPIADFANKNAWSIWNSKHAGRQAGWLDGRGYRVIHYRSRSLKGSRVVWAITHGEVPDVVDHQDGDTSNDRLANLRNVNQSENARNRTRAVTNSTGVSGVYRSRGDRYAVQINVDGKRRYLGVFPTFEAARRVRKEAEVVYGFHPNHDRSRAEGDDE